MDKVIPKNFGCFVLIHLAKPVQSTRKVLDCLRAMNEEAGTSQ